MSATESPDGDAQDENLSAHERTLQEFKRRENFGAHELHLMRGECNEPMSTRDGDCGFQARYRMVREANEDEEGEFVTKEVCGHHVPDDWKEIANGEQDADFEVLDLKAGCGKGVKKKVYPPKTIEVEPLGEDEVEEVEVPEDMQSPSEKVTDCGRRGFMVFVYEDAANKVFCKQHARQAWVNDLRK